MSLYDKVTDFLPCPFCGRKPHVNGYGWISVSCNHCGITMEDRRGSRNSESDVNALLSKWNRRENK